MRALLHTAFVVGVWAGVAPTALARDDAGRLLLDLRPWPLVVVAGLTLLVGSALVFEPGKQLAAAGAHLFTTRPGPRLVTDRWYARIRNPQEVGTLLVAAAAPMALSALVTWVIPLAALAYTAVALGPYEERRLHEAFEEEWEAYRDRVPRWIPRRSRR